MDYNWEFVVISFKQYISEAFDKPYKITGSRRHRPQMGIKDYMKGGFAGVAFDFKTDDGRKGAVYTYAYDINPPAKYANNPIPGMLGNQGRILEMHFEVEGDWEDAGYSRSMSGEITGEGDAMRIFATVLKVVTGVVKKTKPDMIRVYGTKDTKGEVGSRLKLYEKLVKRYAGKLGYKYEGKQIDTDRRNQKVMTLVRKGFDRYPKGHLANP